MSRDDLQKRRAARARSGSRRKRDVEAERTEATRERIEAQNARRARLMAATVKDSPRAAALWEKVLERVKESVPGSTFDLWIEPLNLVGEVNESLHVEAPDRIFFWAERRYGKLLGTVAREVGDRCKGVYITCAEGPVDDRHHDEDGLL